VSESVVIEWNCVCVCVCVCVRVFFNFFYSVYNMLHYTK
jgi:hypothetical protein